MLVEVFPKIKNSLPVRWLRGYFSSPLHFVLIGFLMALGELFAVELAVFWCDLLLGALALFFADDTRAVVPIACCCYMTVAAKNNPIMASEEGRGTIFRDPAFQIQLIFILVVSVILLFARLATLLIKDPRRVGPPRLFAGFAMLGAAYMLGGAASSHYSGRTVLFGFVQILSLAFFYLYFHFTIDWKTTPKWFIPALFLTIGMFVSVEVFGMYRNPGVFAADGTVVRGALYTGWGTYNNVGCIMAMCIPAPCYFAATRKHGWVYLLLSTYLLFATILTQSRGGMIFGVVCYALCALWVLAASRGKERAYNFALYMAVLAAFFLAFLIFREELNVLFASIVKAGLNDSNRFEIWKNCWAAFKKHPLFGVGFYHTPGFGFEYNADHGAFIPARAHNTYIQLMATGGIVLVCAYLFHRVQTLALLLKAPSTEKLFALFVVAALILTSIVDCHFFNIGPGILYGVALCFAEGTEGARPKPLRPPAALACQIP